MRILEMEATFGKLDHAKLAFGPGLSVITAPNEWGKSTWCAFLVAMLYGVDTRERTGKDTIAVKEKYAPWSGRPMEGVLRIEHQGRRITIERSQKGRTPLGEFRAYETDTGLELPGMTGENCGQMLTGVEKSVFCRSAFVRFSDLPVEADENLRRRLNALVTTGDESGSADRLGSRLAELKRRIRYNKSGLLPQTQQTLAALRRQLQEAQALQERQTQLAGELSRGRSRLAELELHRQMCEYRAARASRERLEAAAEEARAVREELDGLEECCAGLPDRQELQAKLQQGYALLQQLQIPSQIPVGSAVPTVLACLAAAAVLIPGVVLCLKGELIAGILLVMAGVTAGIAAAAAALRRAHTRSVRDAELARREARRTELEQTMARWQQQTEDLARRESARVRAEQSRKRLQDLLATVQQVEKPEGDDRLELSSEETGRELEALRQNLRSWQIQQAQLTGQMEHLPQTESLQQQIAAQQTRLRELERYYRALEYSQAALETAAQELQRRFAPRITRRAGELLTRLTGGRYTRFSIGEDLSLHAAQQEETTLRSGRWRSDGTGDQMYLALRLAVWEVLCPDAPLILDDALIRFDDKRLACAMQVLDELGREHQILLFSCRSREQELLSE